MANYLKKFNFLYGIILIIICIIPARIAQDISQALLRLINNIAAYFDFMGVSGGYVGMFYEKLIVEGLGAAVYCGGMLLFPMYLNKNLVPYMKPQKIIFEKIKINSRFKKR